MIIVPRWRGVGWILQRSFRAQRGIQSDIEFGKFSGFFTIVQKAAATLSPPLKKGGGGFSFLYSSLGSERRCYSFSPFEKGGSGDFSIPVFITTFTQKQLLLINCFCGVPKMLFQVYCFIKKSNSFLL